MSSPSFRVQSSKSKVQSQGCSSIFEPGTFDSGLIVRELRKTYRSATGRVEVLRGVSFSAEAGEMVAIMGASGAGKSTLLHILGGLDEADGGSAALNGFDITSASVAELTRFRNCQIGFVFQFHYLLPDLTAIENVALPLLINRVNRGESLDRAADILAQVDLADHAKRSVTELSGGEQQRVAIARALITKPRLVLADEPTGDLDAAAGDRCAQLLASLCHIRGAAAIIATHNERLARVCDRKLLLQDGRLIASPKSEV